MIAWAVALVLGLSRYLETPANNWLILALSGLIATSDTAFAGSLRPKIRLFTSVFGALSGNSLYSGVSGPTDSFKVKPTWRRFCIAVLTVDVSSVPLKVLERRVTPSGSFSNSRRAEPGSSAMSLKNCNEEVTNALPRLDFSA